MFLFVALLISRLSCENTQKHLYESVKHSISINSESFVFYDIKNSIAAKAVEVELNSDEYNISNLIFKDGDVVIDIGGNIGMFSILLARKYPFLKIYSFEPDVRNFENFKRNVKVNNIKSGVITLKNLALTKDGRNVSMHMSDKNTGGSMMSEVMSARLRKRRHVVFERQVESATLETIFIKHQIDRCRLLKIDCEGCEYEVLYNTPDSLLRRIEVFRGEFHSRSPLLSLGFSPERLFKDMKSKFEDFNVTTIPIQKKKKRTNTLKHKHRI